MISNILNLEEKVIEPQNTSKNFNFKLLATTSRAADVGMLLQVAKSKYNNQRTARNKIQ